MSAIARLEAAGGVERWSDAAERTTRRSRRRCAGATEEQRRVRRELAGESRGRDDGASLELGIGGSRSPAHLKCLHAHVAFALARPGYALGERIFAEVVDPWPTDRCCSEVWTSSPARVGRSRERESGLGARVPATRRGRATTRSRAERVRPQLEAVTSELRRRVGGTFTLRELAEEYARADGWARDVLAEQARSPDWPRTLALVEGAAFHLYARGAVGLHAVTALERDRAPASHDGRAGGSGRARAVLARRRRSSLAFLLGIAFAEHARRAPESGGDVTDVRTLTPASAGAAGQDGDRDRDRCDGRRVAALQLFGGLEQAGEDDRRRAQARLIQIPTPRLAKKKCPGSR